MKLSQLHVPRFISSETEHIFPTYTRHMHKHVYTTFKYTMVCTDQYRETQSTYTQTAQKAMASSCFPLCWAGWSSAGSMYMCICTLWFPPQLGLRSQSAQLLAPGHTMPSSSCWHKCSHMQSELEFSWPSLITPHPIPVLSLLEIHSPPGSQATTLTWWLTWFDLCWHSRTQSTTCSSGWHHGHLCPCNLRSRSSFWHWRPPTGVLAPQTYRPSNLRLAAITSPYTHTLETLIQEKSEKKC